MNKNQNHGGIAVPALRDPLVATSLSVIPGLGQIYNLEPRKGVLFFLVGTTNIILIGTLAWSQQLVSTLKTFGTEYNITPNADIAHALSSIHFGSPPMNVLSALFAAFIAYAMRDAYDRARTVRRNAIYSPTAMQFAEASSGSYLFHAALMMTLVLFAFFFLIPSPPKVQVTTIEFMSPKLETTRPQKQRAKAHINSEALHDPRHTRIVRNPSASNTGGTPRTLQRQAEPKASKPAESKQAESKPAASKPKPATPPKTHPAAANPTPVKHLNSPKPTIAPIAQSNPATTKPTPSPMEPQVPLKAVPPLPNFGQQDSPVKPMLDPSKLLASLTPHGAPSASAPIPQPQSVSVRSSGAPNMVPVAAAAGPSNAPAPAIASSSPSRQSGLTVPRIVETGRDRGNGSSDSTGPRPSRDRASGAKETGGRGNDVDKFIGMKPSLPAGDQGKQIGRERPGELGMAPGSKPGTEVQGPSERDVNFGPYMADLQRRIKRNWFPPTDQASKRVTARFTINQSGKLSNLRLAASSGSAVADQAALKAISNAAPFAPLPEGAPESVDIEFKFDYNVFKGSLR